MDDTAHLVASEVAAALDEQLVADLVEGTPADRFRLVSQIVDLTRRSATVRSVQVVDGSGEVFASDDFTAVGRRAAPPAEVFGSRREPVLHAERGNAEFLYPKYLYRSRPRLRAPAALQRSAADRYLRLGLDPLGSSASTPRAAPPVSAPWASGLVRGSPTPAHPAAAHEELVVALEQRARRAADGRPEEPPRRSPSPAASARVPAGAAAQRAADGGCATRRHDGRRAGAALARAPGGVRQRTGALAARAAARPRAGGLADGARLPGELLAERLHGPGERQSGRPRGHPPGQGTPCPLPGLPTRRRRKRRPLGATPRPRAAACRRDRPAHGGPAAGPDPRLPRRGPRPPRPTQRHGAQPRAAPPFARPGNPASRGPRVQATAVGDRHRAGAAAAAPRTRRAAGADRAAVGEGGVVRPPGRARGDRGAALSAGAAAAGDARGSCPKHGKWSPTATITPAAPHRHPRVEGARGGHAAMLSSARDGRGCGSRHRKGIRGAARPHLRLHSPPSKRHRHRLVRGALDFRGAGGNVEGGPAGRR